MRRFLLLFFPVTLLAAQSLNLSVNPTTVRAGGTATLTLTFTDGTPSASIAGLQWTLGVPASITPGTVTSGAASTAAAKVITCGPAACLAAGTGATLNANAFGGGVVSTYPLTVAVGTAPGSLAISLSNVVAADSNGMAVLTLTAGATLTVLSRYDVTGDGLVNSADVAAVLGQVTGGSCTTGDVSGDGKCNIVDVTLTILAALGRIPL